MTYRFAVPSRRLGAEFDPLFDAVFPARPARDARPTSWVPAAHAVEAADRYVVSLDLPGVPAEKVRVVAEKGRLRVSGERPAPTLEGTPQLVERHHGTFERTFRLPASVEVGKIEAAAADGVLTITLPKRDPAIARTIEIKGA